MGYLVDLILFYSPPVKAGNIGGWCNGSTFDFGSESIGSSPVPPTLSYLNNIMCIIKPVTTLAWESRGIFLRQL